MGRIKIKDLPKDMKLTEEDLRKVRGGIGIMQPNDRRLLLSGLLGGTSRLRIPSGTSSLRFGIDQRDWNQGPA
jgi:hypothetical protein